MLQPLPRHLLHQVHPTRPRKLIEMVLSTILLFIGIAVLSFFIYKYRVSKPYWLISIQSLLLLTLLCITPLTKQTSSSVFSTISTGCTHYKISSSIRTTSSWSAISASHIFWSKRMRYPTSRLKDCRFGWTKIVGRWICRELSFSVWWLCCLPCI